MSHPVYMDEHKNPYPDRKLMGSVLRREIVREHRTVSNFTKEAPKVSRKTIERIMAGDPSVEREAIEYIEGRLGMPRDTLALIADHDVQGLREIGVDADLVRTVIQEITMNNGQMGTTVTGAL